MKLVMRVYNDETGDELEERELELDDIGQVSDAIDEVVLRDGQSLVAEGESAKKAGLFDKLFGG